LRAQREGTGLSGYVIPDEAVGGCRKQLEEWRAENSPLELNRSFQGSFKTIVAVNSALAE